MSSTSSSRPQPSVTGLRPTVTRILSAASRISFSSPTSTTSASPFALKPFRLGVGQRLDAELAQALGDGTRQLRVVLRQDARHRLDDRHRRAHLGESRAELQPDIAAADDDQLLRDLVEGQSLRRRNDRSAERQRRQFDRRRTRRDDDRLGADDLQPGFRLHGDRFAVAEPRRARDDLDLALLQQACDAAAQSGDDCRPSRRSSWRDRFQARSAKFPAGSGRPPYAAPFQIPRRRESAPWRECSRR